MTSGADAIFASQSGQKAFWLGTLCALILTISPGLAIPSLLVAAPLAAAVVLWLNGRETSGKRLEEIR